MEKYESESGELYLHLSNVIGTGAVQLVKSLLPELLRISEHTTTVILPDRGELSDFKWKSNQVRVVNVRRRLPKFISRFFECFFSSFKLPDNSKLLVLGDLPLRTNASQTLFVQTSNLVRNHKPSLINFDYLKYSVAQSIFLLNHKYVKHYIVQTEVMKERLESFYPVVKGRVSVVPQPVPGWLIHSDVFRVGRCTSGGLRLFYPAASYPHKNHRLLSNVNAEDFHCWPVENITLTIDSFCNPNLDWPAIQCVGLIAPDKMVSFYKESDALIFLSQEESFGFPLIEAMYCGIPIVCPDLPYARMLCGDMAIYFQDNNVMSLLEAIVILKHKLDEGWWPDWQEQLDYLPADWNLVAVKMFNISMDLEG